jgi:hypothetical protein
LGYADIFGPLARARNLKCTTVLRTPTFGLQTFCAGPVP